MKWISSVKDKLPEYYRRGNVMMWIDIEEKKPAFNEVVFVMTGAPNLYIAIYKNDNTFENVSCISCSEIMAEDKYFPVKYWIPIPNQPECSKQEDLNNEDFLCDPASTNGNTTKHCCMSVKKAKELLGMRRSEHY